MIPRGMEFPSGLRYNKNVLHTEVWSPGNVSPQDLTTKRELVTQLLGADESAIEAT